MTGRLAIWPQDLRNFVNLLVVGFLSAMAITTPAIVVVLLFGLAGLMTTGLLIVAVPWAAALLYLVSRSAFFLPALAIDDPVTFWRAFDRGRPYWARLAIVFLIVFAPTAVLVWGLGKLGLPWPVRSALEALVGAAAALMAGSAACYLYWRHARAGE